MESQKKERGVRSYQTWYRAGFFRAGRSWLDRLKVDRRVSFLTSLRVWAKARGTVANTSIFSQ